MSSDILVQEALQHSRLHHVCNSAAQRLRISKVLFLWNCISQQALSSRSLYSFQCPWLCAYHSTLWLKFFLHHPGRIQSLQGNPNLLFDHFIFSISPLSYPNSLFFIKASMQRSSWFCSCQSVATKNTKWEQLNQQPCLLKLSAWQRCQSIVSKPDFYMQGVAEHVLVSFIFLRRAAKWHNQFFQAFVFHLMFTLLTA